MTATAKTEYDALAKELSEIETRIGLFLTDENADAENSLCAGSYGTEEFWSAMLYSAKIAAGQRAENAGFDINNLVGRVIY